MHFIFYYFLCLKVNLDLEKTNQLGESSPNFIFAVVNLDPIILEKRWIDGESWPNNFVEKVNRGEDLRWEGSRCLWRMLKSLIFMKKSIDLNHDLNQWFKSRWFKSANPGRIHILGSNLNRGFFFLTYLCVLVPPEHHSCFYKFTEKQIIFAATWFRESLNPQIFVTS